MAFRQPTYHAPQRVYTSSEEQPHTQQPQSSIQSQPLEESQEWILFSPLAPSVTDRTYTTSTDRTRTAGHSRISDFGSLDTAARSLGYEEGSAHTEGVIEEEEEEEDGELDSLDSHLHEFGAEPSVYRGENQRSGEASGTVLPTHDGLGSFRVDQTAMGDEVQQHLYAFERFNPRRVKRRRESAAADQVLFEVDADRAAEAERTRRIEAWRMEQSRLLVDEIQRETRRRKQSMSSERRASVFEREQEDVATLSNVDESMAGNGHDHVVEDPQENESFWNRITKRVIRDLMGIDDDLLSIIFGESLPEEDDTLSSTPRANSPLDASTTIASTQYDESSWEYRLLERIARELGILVNQISDHPGAFSTYLETSNSPLPYAGLPMIPESSHSIFTSQNQNQSQSRAIPQTPGTTRTTAETPLFKPTLQSTPLPLPLPIQIPISSTSLASATSLSPSAHLHHHLPPPLTRSDWERDLDIKMVFRYLRSRFSHFSSSSSSPQSYNNTPTPASYLTSRTDGNGTMFPHPSVLATASTADTAARAARVRQHHPLVTGERRVSNPYQSQQSQQSQQRRTFRVSMPISGGKDAVPSTSVNTGAGMQARTRRTSSSCASSYAAREREKRSGSSRNYWDLDFGSSGAAGGSGGGGSLIASTGGMGSWGEV